MEWFRMLDVASRYKIFGFVINEAVCKCEKEKKKNANV